MKQIILLFTLLIGSTLSAQIWQPDYDSALALAKKTERPLIVVFAGSDWCAPCIKLDREIWQSDVFKGYAADNYVVYRADFPRKKKNQLAEKESSANAKLAEKFNPKRVFPPSCCYGCPRKRF